MYKPHEDVGLGHEYPENREISSEPGRIIVESRYIGRSPEQLHQVGDRGSDRYFYDNENQIDLAFDAAHKAIDAAAPDHPLSRGTGRSHSRSSSLRP